MKKFVFNNNVKIWTESFGSKDNPTILLILGAGAVNTFWHNSFCEQLVAAGFFVIRYDQRDYGRSTHFLLIDIAKINQLSPTSKPFEIPYTIDDLVGDALKILDSYGIQKAHIVGHSMGGLIAQLFAIKNSNRILSLISISVGPLTYSIKLPPIKQEVLNVLLSNKPTQNFEKDLSGWMKSWKLLHGSYPMEEERAIQYTKDIYKWEPQVGIAWNHIAIQRVMPDMINELQNITIPCLIIHGEEDKLQPVEYGITTGKLIPNAKVKIIKKAGHLFFNKKLWQSIANIITAFISNISSK